METLGATGFQSYYQFSPSYYYDQVGFQEVVHEDCVEYPVQDDTNINYSPDTQGIDLYYGRLSSCNEYENVYQDCITNLTNNQLMDTYESYDNEEICLYADNPLEINLSQEKILGQFNVPHCIDYQRRRCDINYIISTYGQSFAFFCKSCLERCEISQESSDNTHRCGGSIAHYWESTKLLQCITKSGMFTIRKPFTVRKEACYSMCPSGSFCTKHLCTYAHSEVERDIWRLERDQGFVQERLVEVCKDLQCSDPSDNNEQPDMFHIETEDHRDDCIDYQRRRCDINYIISTYGQSFAFFCKSCLERCEISQESSDNPHQCGGSIAHYWESTKLLQCITKSGMFTIRKPFTVRKEACYSICPSGSFCTKHLCTYAHSEVERDIWRLERDQGFVQERLVEVCKDLHGSDPSGNSEQPDMFHVETEDHRDDAGRQRNLILNNHKDYSLRFSSAQNLKLTLNNLKLHDMKLNTINTWAFKSEDVLSNGATFHTPECEVDYSLNASCRNGDEKRSTRFSSRPSLLRRTPYSREDVTNGFERNGLNNKTPRKSLAEKTSSVYNGNYGVCMRTNEIPGGVTLLRRPSDVAENSENPVEILISNDTFATSENNQTIISAENGVVVLNSFVLPDGPQNSNPYLKSFSVPENNKRLLQYMTVKDRTENTHSFPNGKSSVENGAIANGCAGLPQPSLGSTLSLDSSNDKQDKEINDSFLDENKELCDRPEQKEETPDEESDVDEWEMLSREIFHEVHLGLNPAYYTMELADGDLH